MSGAPAPVALEQAGRGVDQEREQQAFGFGEIQGALQGAPGGAGGTGLGAGDRFE